jgi:hypothetical protein
MLLEPLQLHFEYFDKQFVFSFLHPHFSFADLVKPFLFLQPLLV